MPKFDVHAALLAVALEERLRLTAQLERDVLALPPPGAVARSIVTVGAALNTGLSALSPVQVEWREKRNAQLRWLRESLEHDLCPAWLVRLVVANWTYVPEWEWD